MSLCTELQRPRPADPHRTLDPVRAEMKIANALFLADFDRRGHGAAGSANAITESPHPPSAPWPPAAITTYWRPPLA